MRLAPFLDAITATRSRVSFIDLTFAADKSVSVAWAMASTEAERALILAAHRTAVASAVREVERDLGRARKGKGGRGGFDQGHIGWVAFEHFTARPTVEIATTDPTTGEAYSEILTAPHSWRSACPYSCCGAALCAGRCARKGAPARVGSLDLSRLQGRVHELGALYQAYLATNLRALGIDIVLDAATGAARMSAVPDDVRAAFSKRTTRGEIAARGYAQAAGLNWIALDAGRRIALLKQGTQGDPRAAKRDDLGDFERWRAQLRRLADVQGALSTSTRPRCTLETHERLKAAYIAALPFLEKELAQGRP